MTLTDNKEERPRKRKIFNAWWLVHWHQLRSQMSQVFQVTSHIVEIFALHFVSPIQLLLLYQFIQFLTCTRIPCRDSHRENGLVRCCLYTHRRLQQTAVSCERSICTKIREKNVKVARLKFDPKTANNGSPRSIMSLCMYVHLWTFFELLWAPPGIAPLSPPGGRTRWLVPVLILPEWHWPELSFSRFLV